LKKSLTAWTRSLIGGDVPFTFPSIPPHRVLRYSRWAVGSLVGRDSSARRDAVRTTEQLLEVFRRRPGAVRRPRLGWGQGVRGIASDGVVFPGSPPEYLESASRLTPRRAFLTCRRRLASRLAAYAAADDLAVRIHVEVVDVHAGAADGAGTKLLFRSFRHSPPPSGISPRQLTRVDRLSMRELHLDAVRVTDDTEVSHDRPRVHGLHFQDAVGSGRLRRRVHLVAR